MKSNKKGAVPAPLAVFGVLALLILSVLAFNFVSDRIGDAKNKAGSAMDLLQDSQSVYELMGSNDNYLKPVSYVIGEVPTAIVRGTSTIGAIIVIALVFAILVLMFGDILSAFGSFSNDYVAWSVGLALAIIGANFKLVMLFAATGFALVSGAGVFAAILGVLVPFVIYIVVHLLFLYNIKNFRNQANFRQGIADITRGVRASKTFGKAVRSK